jgi:hypothetical protein
VEAITSIFVLILGLLARLALPIGITWVLVFWLRKLDAHWQAGAIAQPQVEKPECWKIKGCTPEQRENCPAFLSPLPCWQVYRLPNGYLNEKCLTCKVFIDTPVPALHIEPRRI